MSIYYWWVIWNIKRRFSKVPYPMFRSFTYNHQWGDIKPTVTPCKLFSSLEPTTTKKHKTKAVEEEYHFIQFLQGVTLDFKPFGPYWYTFNDLKRFISPFHASFCLWSGIKSPLSSNLNPSLHTGLLIWSLVWQSWHMALIFSWFNVMLGSFILLGVTCITWWHMVAGCPQLSQMLISKL